MLLARRVDAERHQQQVLAQPGPVDHQAGKVQLSERPAQELLDARRRWSGSSPVAHSQLGRRISSPLTLRTRGFKTRTFRPTMTTAPSSQPWR
jgi:hypothetical protein